MRKQKKLSATSKEVDGAFGVLDDALRATGRILSTDEESVRQSDEHIDLESVTLPEALRDPMYVLQRGREILAHGFSSGHAGPPTSEAGRHLAHAARNGQAIPDEVRRRMHADRKATSDKKKKA